MAPRHWGITVPEFLQQLRAVGLRTLPGTAAEILDDEVRAQICPDKISTRQWLDIMTGPMQAACQPPQRLCLAMLTAPGIGGAICCI